MQVNFTVNTLGSEFVTGLSGSATLSDFPSSGKETTLNWQQSKQGFGISSVAAAGNLPLIKRGSELITLTASSSSSEVDVWSRISTSADEGRVRLQDTVAPPYRNWRVVKVRQAARQRDISSVPRRVWNFKASPKRVKAVKTRVYCQLIINFEY